MIMTQSDFRAFDRVDDSDPALVAMRRARFLLETERGNPDKTFTAHKGASKALAVSITELETAILWRVQDLMLKRTQATAEAESERPAHGEDQGQ